MQQTLLIRSIPWSDAYSGQQTLELETSNGQRFTCFMDGGGATAGSRAVIGGFCYLDARYDLLDGEHVRARSITQLAEWDVEVVGVVVRVDDDAVWLDAGGVFLPLLRFTRDPRAEGTWLCVAYTRLEALIAA